MKTHRIGIILNGVTGRMGTHQHLLRSIDAILKQGGIRIGPEETLLPDPILVGRNESKLQSLIARTSVEKYTTDLDSVMNDPSYEVYFDAQTTLRRFEAVKQAAAAGKHVYCEKPTAIRTEDAYALYQICRDAGVKHGVVQDKLWLPGLVKFMRLKENGFFGDILSVRGEFGYWVFEGHTVPPQRPSWNYRKEDGGGMVVDMLCHWRYVIDHLFGPVKRVSTLAATHIPERIDESGHPYPCTADDSAYSTFELENGIICHFNSSWNVRVRRDDLLTMQVDGTRGSAVIGLRDCWIQHYGNTPRPVWNPDIPQPIDFFEGWSKVPDQETYDNAFKVQWEMFLRHVAFDEPWKFDLLEGAKGVQLAELGLQSSAERRWLDIPELKP
ncbi:putative dehydrogenase [Haloferula luteola]|uniref:Putative dehydrogenase n=1 Tax=Haloferula luteola TaxID=595692 RepID=A0A840VCT5_9BACT|nr:Gfo/Idh/MocA family oxidoreductase [Haloferula luteola]MBB5351710.1 putative dehydrogenase [Haloferula luteola]